MNDAPIGLLLAECNLLLQYKGSAGEFPCRVFFDLHLNNSLVIDVLESVQSICSDLLTPESFYVTVPGTQKPIECFVIASSQRFGGEKSGLFIKLAPRFSLIEIDRLSPLVRVNAGVLNLGHYRFPRPDGISAFSLQHDDWHFEFTPIDERTLQYPAKFQSLEYSLTHHVTITRVGGGVFTCTEAHQQLALLSQFLSFCHGYWVSTCLAYGVGRDGSVVMQEWGTRLVSPWRRTTNWLDEHNGPCIEELFPAFVTKIEHPQWKDAIEHALYWYIRSDTALNGSDGACILLQAALERLAWHVLVREKQSLSEDGFHKLPAADQLRLLLATLAIPLAIPPELPSLHQIAKELNWDDGPQAFVEIRNRLVHPPKKKHGQKGLPYYDAFLLAKWYLELSILSSCGYSGVYSNRTRRQRWVGQVEPVPWKQ